MNAFFFFRGDILYYTQPPIQHTLPRHISAKIVTQMSAAFNIDALLGMETDDLNGKNYTPRPGYMTKHDSPLKAAESCLVMYPGSSSHAPGIVSV